MSPRLPKSLGIIIALAGAAGLIAVYHYETVNRSATTINNNYQPPPSQPLVTPPASAATSVPSVAFLMANPSALKAAEAQCGSQSSTSNDVALCDNVHSAESGLLAQQYRNAAAGKLQ